MSYYDGMDAEEFSRLPHDNRMGDTITAVVLCMFFATVAVCLRLYTRHFILRGVWYDDYMALAGMVSHLLRLRIDINMRRRSNEQYLTRSTRSECSPTA